MTPAPQTLCPDASQALQTAPDLPEWDSLVLPELVGTNPAVHHRLLTIYLTNTRGQISHLNRASQTLDLPATITLAHTLKSASRTVGAMALGGLCRELEAAARAADGARCLALSAQLPDAFARVEQHITTVLELTA